jgi:hypothetical protein
MHKLLFYWSQRAELNRRPTDYESVIQSKTKLLEFSSNATHYKKWATDKTVSH